MNIKRLAIFLIIFSFFIIAPFSNYTKASSGDPVVSWLFYPTAEFMTAALDNKLCRESADMYEQIFGPSVVIGGKYGTCVADEERYSQFNPNYWGEGAGRKAEVKYFTRETNTFTISSWFIANAKKKGWELQSKNEYSYCGGAEKTLTLSFGSFNLELVPRILCDASSGVSKVVWHQGTDIFLTVNLADAKIGDVRRTGGEDFVLPEESATSIWQRLWSFILRLFLRR